MDSFSLLTFVPLTVHLEPGRVGVGAGRVGDAAGVVAGVLGLEALEGEVAAELVGLPHLRKGQARAERGTELGAPGNCVCVCVS